MKDIHNPKKNSTNFVKVLSTRRFTKKQKILIANYYTFDDPVKHLFDSVVVHHKTVFAVVVVVVVATKTAAVDNCMLNDGLLVAAAE